MVITTMSLNIAARRRDGREKAGEGNMVPDLRENSLRTCRIKTPQLF